MVFEKTLEATHSADKALFRATFLRALHAATFGLLTASMLFF
jgi:hypothetical protein